MKKYSTKEVAMVITVQHPTVWHLLNATMLPMHVGHSRENTPQLIISNMAVQGDGTIIRLSMDHANKVRVLERK